MTRRSFVHGNRIASVATALLGLTALLASRGQAQVTLWDQSGVNSAHNVIDQDLTDLPQFTTYQVNDFTLTQNVTITDVFTYFLAFPADPGPSIPAFVSLFSKTGSLPTGGDTPGNLGTVTASWDNTTGVLHASGLSISLAPGDYWIGLTPSANFASFGQAFHFESSSSSGDAAAVINPGNGFGHGSGWQPAAPTFAASYGDGAFKILGNIVTTAPEPASLALFGMAALPMIGMVRRRKV